MWTVFAHFSLSPDLVPNRRRSLWEDVLLLTCVNHPWARLCCCVFVNGHTWGGGHTPDAAPVCSVSSLSLHSPSISLYCAPASCSTALFTFVIIISLSISSSLLTWLISSSPSPTQSVLSCCLHGVNVTSRAKRNAQSKHVAFACFLPINECSI